MTNQIRPGIDRTRVPSTAAMRARDVSRNPEAEALALRGDGDLTPPTEQSSKGETGHPKGEDPQPPADRPDS